MVSKQSIFLGNEGVILSKAGIGKVIQGQIRGVSYPFRERNNTIYKAVEVLQTVSNIFNLKSICFSKRWRCLICVYQTEPKTCTSTRQIVLHFLF
jgi:hypothetical protein